MRRMPERIRWGKLRWCSSEWISLKTHRMVPYMNCLKLQVTMREPARVLNFFLIRAGYLDDALSITMVKWIAFTAHHSLNWVNSIFWKCAELVTCGTCYRTQGKNSESQSLSLIVWDLRTSMLFGGSFQTLASERKRQLEAGGSNPTGLERDH